MNKSKGKKAGKICENILFVIGILGIVILYWYDRSITLDPVSYTHLLKLAGVEMNRKMLAEMAVNDAEGFATLAELAKSKVA